MKNLSLFKSVRVLVFVGLQVLLIANCGDPIPIEEMGNAKLAIARADSMQAAKYAPEKFEAAKKALFDSHELVSNEKVSDAKLKAEESKKLADEAFEIAAPLLAQDTRKEADAALREADDAFAEQFAPEDFKNAKTALAQGDQYYESKDFVGAYHTFEDTREKARTARNKSEAQIETMQRDITEIEATIAAAERSGAAENAPDHLKAAKEKSAFAKQHLSEKKLKLAYGEIQTAKESARQALMISQKETARKKYEVASAAVANAEAKYNELKTKSTEEKAQKALEKSPEAQEAMKAAADNMTAAKEALRSADEAMKNQAFTDSLNQSEEAIRLSKILSDSLPETEVLLAQARDRAAEEDLKQQQKEPVVTPKVDNPENKSEPKKANISKGWKSYKVRLIPKNRDCLWKIASYKYIYKNARLWPKIYKANKRQIKNPDLIYPGQIFKIPPKGQPTKQSSKVMTKEGGEENTSEKTGSDVENPSSEGTKNAE